MGPPAGLAPSAAAIRTAKGERTKALLLWAIPLSLTLTGLYWRLAVGTLPLGLGIVSWVLPAAIVAVVAALMWALIVEPNSRGNALGDELLASKSIDAQAVKQDEALIAHGKQLKEHGEFCVEVVAAELLEADERITDALEMSHRALQIAASALGVRDVPAVRSENLVRPTMPHIERIRSKVGTELATLRELTPPLSTQHMPMPMALPSPHIALTSPADIAPSADQADPRGLPSFAPSAFGGVPLTTDPANTVEGHRRGRRILLTVFVAVLIAATLVWLIVSHSGWSISAAPPVSTNSPSPGTASLLPNDLVPASPAVPAGLTEGVDFSFLDRDSSGQVGRWGCHAPITVRLAGPAPAGATLAMASAVTALRDASGLPLNIGPPMPKAVLHAADVPPGQIIYNYLMPKDITAAKLDITGTVLGEGGPQTDPVTGRILSGWVAIRADGAADPNTTLGKQVAWHEGAHALGLGHAEQNSPHPEIMAPSTDGTGPLSWGPGDRYALAAVGCVQKSS